MKYTKIPFKTEDHIQLLIDRKLVINDKARAEKYLKNIGYYRLTGYMYHLQKDDGSHEFKKDISFDTIIQHYHFDKRLRLFVLGYLERIEVCLRAKLTDYYSLQHGFFWYKDHKLFEDISTYQTINEEILSRFLDPQERYLKSFKLKYTGEDSPPSNMAMEILSLGKLSRLYNTLVNGEEKMQIADEFGLPSKILSSWLIYLNNVRNICAHHDRLWNRGLTADRPTIPKREKFKFHGNLPDNFNRSVYGVVCMIDRLLNNTNSNNMFVTKLIDLIDSYDCIETGYMGFPKDWKQNPAWGYCRLKL